MHRIDKICKRKKKRIIPAVLWLLLLYIVLGAVLPLLHHKQASDSVKQSFSAADCYGEQAGTERVLCIDDNLDALLWRIRVIETAQEEIVFSTFDFGDDESGQDVMALLLHAADRGVHVRMLVDGLNGMLKLSGSSNFKALISHPKVEAKLYNRPNPLLPWKMTLRMHDKYLIADDFVYILGGRNTNNLFLGDYSETVNTDRDLLICETDRGNETGSLSQLQDYFAEIWSLSCNRDMTYTGSSQRVEEAGRYLRSRYDELKEKYSDAFTETDYVGATMAAKRITLLNNPMEPVNREPDLWYMLHQLMAEGSDVLIQTPYIVCGRDMYGDLEALCRTADVELIINAVERGANPWGCTDYLNQKGKIRKTGLEVYELLGEHSSHTKTILVDDRLSIVGSYNLDMRSTYLDTEMMLAVDCEALNGELRASALMDKSRSKHVYPDGTYECGEQYRPVELSSGKKVFYGVLRVVTLPIRHLL